METKKGITRVVIMALILLVAAAGIWARPVQESKGINSTFQFFNSSVYEHLTDPDPVYRTISYDQMIRLFESEGTYMILYGGAWCGNTQAVVSQINDVAKEYGVEAIYNYDWRVDGAKYHLRDNRNEFRALYVDVINTYLTNIVTLYDEETKGIFYEDEAGEKFIAHKLQVPFLFVYNKDNVDANGNTAPILASFEKMVRWDADFQTDGVDDEAKLEAYRAEIRPLFDLVATKSATGKTVAQLDTYSDFEYFATSYNEKAGTTILDSADDPWVMQTVSYIELTNLLESEGDYVVMFGGPWCGNTRAVVKYVNEYAVKHNVDTVYTFDTKLDSASLQIRDTKSPYAHLYVDLVLEYFPNIITENQFPDRNIQYTDESGAAVASNRMQVPYVFAYNKDRVDSSGNPDPIMDQIELMVRWENVQPDYKNEDGVVGANYKAYTEALDALFTQFATEVQ